MLARSPEYLDEFPVIYENIYVTHKFDLTYQPAVRELASGEGQEMQAPGFARAVISHSAKVASLASNARWSETPSPTSHHTMTVSSVRYATNCC